MVMRGFQAGASPGPETSRKITVALNASARVELARGGMQRDQPLHEPGPAGQEAGAKARITAATSRRRAARPSLG